MDTQSSMQNMDASSIAALSSVKEVADEKKGGMFHTLILLLMVVFALFIVGLSVFNFKGLIKIQNASTRVVNYNNQVQKLAR